MRRVQSYGIPWLRSTNPTGQVTQEKVCACVIESWCNKPNPHTKEVLEDMKAAGCRIYLLSNAQAEFTNPEIDLVGLRELFHAIYLSSDAGIRKPQPEFLLEVIKEHQLNPEKTVMVGNDFTTDVAVAKSIGMQSILINTFPYSEAELREKSQAGVRVIQDIQELQED